MGRPGGVYRHKPAQGRTRLHPPGTVCYTARSLREVSVVKKTPLQMIKDRYTDKNGAITALKALVGDELVEDRFAEGKGLDHVSNAKILKLIDTAADVKKRWGSRAGLVDAIVKLEKRKDEGFKTRLGKFPLPRLADHMRALERRVKAAKAT